MAFYNAVQSTAIDDSQIWEVCRFEPASIQSILVYNAGPNTAYIGDTEVTDTTGFPIPMNGTLELSWMDFAPGCRTTDNIVIYAINAAAETSTIWVYGWMKRVF